MSIFSEDLFDMIIGLVIVVAIVSVWSFSLPVHAAWAGIFAVSSLLGFGLALKGAVRIVRKL